MKWCRYFFGAVSVGLLSLVYNNLVFFAFDFYPDFLVESWMFEVHWFYLAIFTKGFVVGLILMMFFSLGYRNLLHDNGQRGRMVKGILFMAFYAIFAFFAFTFGDLFLMRSYEGLLILLTVDGVMETLIATVPIRIFTGWPEK